jgi:hypothetical protein
MYSEIARCERCSARFYRRPDESWKTLCKSCYIKTKREESKREALRTSEIEKDLSDHLPTLIQLCHPDKHGNSEAANRATNWLLTLRKMRAKQ